MLKSVGAANTSGTVADTRTISTTAPLAGGGDLSANRTITTSMATNKLIGRGTAATGVMEEITLGTNLTLTGTTLDAAGIAVANPGAQVLGLTAINGSAATAMRSDGAPALDVTIVPTWTGVHTFSLAEPRIRLSESDQGSDLKLWDVDLNGGVLTIRTRTDADGAGVNAIAITRGSTTAITNIALGNATNNPTGSWLGSGTFTFSGNITTSGTATLGRVDVTSATIPTRGIYVPGTNRLGFSSAATYRGEFDANGNFITVKAVADQSKSVQVPTTGFSITVADNISALILNPAGTLATGTITMPATPIDGQIIRFSSSQTITALTVSANSGQTISGAPSTMGATLPFAYIYHLAGTNWYRI